MDKGSRIFVAGHKGLAGSAICRRLCAGGYTNLLLRTRAELDLRDRSRVEEFFRSERPEYVFLAAAKVGGILANSTYPADFLFDNLSIQNNVIDAAARYGVAEARLPGVVLHLPQVRPATHARGIPPHRRARTHQ